MLGGGVFSVLGLGVEVAGSGAYASFAVGGIAALLTGYSYAKLSVRYPARAGTVEFLKRGFPGQYLAGSLSVLLWLGYLVMLALYSSAMGSYLAGLLTGGSDGLWGHVFTSFAIVSFTLLNVLEAQVVGRAASALAGVLLVSLLLFVVVGMPSVQAGRVSPGGFRSSGSVVLAGTLLFLAYEGFELIANAAEEVREPSRTLPLAIYGSIACALVSYVAVAFVAVGNLSDERIKRESDLALAVAAESFAGRPGFLFMAVAAVVSTGSAVNATLFATARFTPEIARSGSAPRAFLHPLWGRDVTGLLLSTLGTLILANFVNIVSISLTGSVVFLVIFGAANMANLRLATETGASRPLALLAVLVCVGSIGVLLVYAAMSTPISLAVLAGMVTVAVISHVAYQVSRPSA